MNGGLLDFRALSTRSESETHPDIVPMSCSIMHTIVRENGEWLSDPLAEKMFA